MDTRRTDAVVSVSVLSKLDLRKNVAGAIFVDLKIQRSHICKKKAKQMRLEYQKNNQSRRVKHRKAGLVKIKHVLLFRINS